ncbi:hypothetical protein HDV01_003936 [Terramyces sp. JEL0728]|nr:hypothetical protein HDV01_003936 [Terramyces sp. JEL0728]
MRIPIWITVDNQTINHHTDNTATLVDRKTRWELVVLVVQNNTLRIQSHRAGWYLTVNKQGSCVFEQDETPQQLFQVVVANSQIHIRNVSSKGYLGVSGKQLICTLDKPAACNVLNAPVCLKAHTGKFMQNVFWYETAEAVNENRDSREQVIIHQLGNGAFRVQSRWNGRCLFVDDDNKCVFLRNKASQRELFQFVEVDGVVRIKSLFNNKWMDCAKVNGKIWCVKEKPDESCNWELEYLDWNNKFNAADLNKYALIGASTVGLGVLAPFAIVGALGAAGFGAGGVVAGSVAAGVQSSIGSVAAGSLFATCQSIGAAGLSAVGITASAAVGGGVGASGGALAGAFMGTEEEQANIAELVTELEKVDLDNNPAGNGENDG